MHIDWVDQPRALDRVCPVCGSGGAKQVRLAVDATLPGQPQLHLLDCAACGSAFYDSLVRPPYDDSGFGARFIKYYVELGAGLDTMIAPLYRIDPARVKNYLEIGCGFGFSLDYARHSFGWTVKGMDPSPLAAAGRDALGLDIDSAYLAGDTDFGATFDLVLCSEVIEHLPAPAELVRSLARTLASDGVLMLTTPNVRAVRPDAPFGVVLPILAPGFHLILYSPESLELVLRENGFPHVRVWEHASALHAVASLRPGMPPREAAVDRDAYRRYLRARTTDPRPDAPVVTDGLRFRMFKELVNAGDYAEAGAVYQTMRDAARSAYGIDLDAPAALALGMASGCTFDEFSRRYPFNLCCVLYFKGMCEFVERRDYPRAIEYFRAAARSGEATSAQLASIGTVDGEVENLVCQARIHTLYSLVYVDPAAALDEFMQLVTPHTPGGSGALCRRLPDELIESARRELFLRLAQAGAHAQARVLRPGVAAALWCRLMTIKAKLFAPARRVGGHAARP